MKLNLGACDRSFPGFLSVDIVPADVICDLRLAPWPWPDSSVEEIKAFDVIEHIGDGYRLEKEFRDGVLVDVRLVEFKGKQHFMNEAYRVLKPDGILDIDVPTTEGRGAWQDPTHVSYWNRNSFFYYEAGNTHLSRFSPANGVRCGGFKVVSSAQSKLSDNVEKLRIVLKAVK